MSFNVGRLTDAEYRLRHDFSEFSRLWQSVREDWRDERCARFERERLSSLGPSLNRFTAALHEFCDAAREAERALRDESRAADELD
jgi:hypothetical protein